MQRYCERKFTGPTVKQSKAARRGLAGPAGYSARAIRTSTVPGSRGKTTTLQGNPRILLPIEPRNPALSAAYAVHVYKLDVQLSRSIINFSWLDHRQSCSVSLDSSLRVELSNSFACATFPSCASIAGSLASLGV